MRGLRQGRIDSKRLLSWSRASGALAAVVLIALAIGGCASGGSVVDQGRPAPGFVVWTLDGRETRLSDFKGKTVVLNVWATWCGYCRAEMPELESAYQQYRDQGLVVLGVNAQESEERVRQYVSQLGITFPILLDTNGSVSHAYRIQGLPTTFFIDADGVIRGQMVGQLTKETLLKGIRAASKGSIE